MLVAEIGFNCPNGFKEKDENIKSLRQEQRYCFMIWLTLTLCNQICFLF